ncbi:hypothetical protein KC614_03070, partial [candidate division WWE3 bacterium]|nr:hypothetical protein [candidate division WWE3 bacterium]
NIYEEFGYTVFDNFVRIPSLSSKTIAFTYTLPAGLGDVGELLIQKQPGVEVVYHTIVTSDGEQAFNLRKDENVSIKL